jgi:predicted heme/steroid binding protein
MSTFTWEEVAKHNHAKDCWIVIDSVVYDVTDFLEDHPGGQRMPLRYAGKDATEEWDAIHGGGTPRKARTLKRFGHLRVGVIGKAAAPAAAPAPEAPAQFAKACALYDHQMAGDADAHAACFRPGAERVQWWEPEHSGAVPQCWNRVQYLGDGVLVETHTAAYVDPGQLLGRSFERLAMCTLDADGRISRLDEFADPKAFVEAGARPVPPPRAPPNTVRRFGAAGGAAGAVQCRALIGRTFDRIMNLEDVGDCFTEDAQATRANSAAFHRPGPWLATC